MTNVPDQVEEYLKILKDKNIDYEIDYTGENRIVIETYPENAHTGEFISFPKNINSETDFVNYIHGAGGFETSSITELENTNPNTAVVSLKGAMTYNEDLSQRIQTNNQIFSNILKDDHQNGAISFSAGSTAAFRSTIDYIKANPDAEPQIITVLDPAFDCRALNGLNQDDINTLRENGSTIIAVDQTDATTYPTYNNAIKRGLNVIVALNDGDHITQRENALKNNIVAFQNGLEDLPESYEFKYFDKKTKEWTYLTNREVSDIINHVATPKTIQFFSNNLRALENVSVEQLSFPIMKRYGKMSDVVKNNIEFVANKTNNLINSIKSTSILNDNGETLDYSSTTKTPSNNPQYLNDFTMNTILMLEKLSTEVDRVIQICSSISNMNESLRIEAENIEEVPNVNNI